MSWRSYFSCRGYSSSMSTWKYSFGCLVVFGDLVLGFFGGGDSGEGGGVAGLCIIGGRDLCCLRWSLHGDGSCVDL